MDILTLLTKKRKSKFDAQNVCTLKINGLKYFIFVLLGIFSLNFHTILYY